jgi:hypothetical protein
VRVTAEDARRFLVARHLLAPARSLEGGPDAVLEVFRTFGSIQFDPLAVAGRNHDLVLHARVADYDPGWCDVLYERRKIFEAYNKGLSLVPVSEFAWFRGILSRNSPRVLAENAEVAKRVLERIRAEGPLSALDFERGRGTTTDWFGMPTNAVRAVLEACAVTGVLGLARRDGNRRYYDLLERLLPGNVLARKLPLQEQLSTNSCRGTELTACLAPPAEETSSAVWAPPSRTRSGPITRDETRCARSSSSAASSFPSRSRACTASASSSRKTSSCCKHRRSRRPPSHSFLLSIHWYGTAASSPACSTSTMCGSSSCHLPNDVGAGTCCRSPSGTASSAGSSLGSTGPRAVCTYSISGGRTASRRAAGFVEAMRDALRAYLRFAGASRLEWAPHLGTEKRLFLTRP